MTRRESLNRTSRYQNYEHTHRVLIEKAAALVTERGVDAFSVSALARTAHINRSTIYYHFQSCEAVIAAVLRWSSEQLATRINPENAQQVGFDYISDFVLHNPAIIDLWIEDYIAVGDIRDQFPQWDSFVVHISQAFAKVSPDEPFDAEVYCTLMLTGVIIAPHVFKNSVHPNESLASIVDRFTQVEQQFLQRQGVAATWVSMAARLLSRGKADIDAPA